MRTIDADALLEELPVHPDGGMRSVKDECLMIRVRQTVKNAPTIGGWISVKDRLPEATKPDVHGNIVFSDYVLTYQTYKDGFNWVTADTCRVDHGVWMHEVPGSGCKVTHWMPLPESPKEEDECNTD